MTQLFKRSDRFTETAIDDEIVVMRLDNGEFFALADSAGAIWRLIDGTRDRTAIISELEETYSSSDRLSDDVDDFVAKLREAGLIEER